jgi:hypothetical protein
MSQMSHCLQYLRAEPSCSRQRADGAGQPAAMGHCTFSPLGQTKEVIVY